MATNNVEKRRKVRALEARRDALMVTAAKNKNELVKVRADLKHTRKAG